MIRDNWPIWLVIGLTGVFLYFFIPALIKEGKEWEAYN